MATEGSFTAAADALREERADVVVATTLGVAAAQIEAAPFCGVRVLPIASRDHPLAWAGNPTPPAVLRTYPQIVLRDSAQGAASPSLNVLEGGLRWSVTDIAAKLQAIRAGIGWGGLPEHVVAGALASGELVALKVREFHADVMELFALRRRDRPHGIVAQTLWEELVRRGATAPRTRRRG